MPTLLCHPASSTVATDRRINHTCRPTGVPTGSAAVAEVVVAFLSTGVCSGLLYGSGQLTVAELTQPTGEQHRIDVGDTRLDVRHAQPGQHPAEVVGDLPGPRQNQMSGRWVGLE